MIDNRFLDWQRSQSDHYQWLAAYIRQHPEHALSFALRFADLLDNSTLSSNAIATVTRLLKHDS